MPWTGCTSFDAEKFRIESDFSTEKECEMDLQRSIFYSLQRSEKLSTWLFILNFQVGKANLMSGKRISTASYDSGSEAEKAYFLSSDEEEGEDSFPESFIIDSSLSTLKIRRMELQKDSLGDSYSLSTSSMLLYWSECQTEATLVHIGYIRLELLLFQSERTLHRLSNHSVPICDFFQYYLADSSRDGTCDRMLFRL